jgi:hypothetical protein
MFMKGVDIADQYPAYYSLLRKTVKWTKKVALWLKNYALFSSFLVYINLNPGSKLKDKEFLVQVAQLRWRPHNQTQAQCNHDHQLTPHVGLMWTPPPPGDFRVTCRNMSSGKSVKSEHGKRKYPARQCHVCTVHNKKSQTRYICEFCIVPLQKGNVFGDPHTQALLGALVKCFLKISFHKNN